jgi:peptide deformylase
MVFINPVISERKGMAEDQEGCLSFPEIFAPVRRPERVTLNAFNLRGEEVSYQLSGLFARAAQHELDHLDGVLFIDRLSPSNRLAIREDLAALEAAFEGDRQRGLIPDDQAIAARLHELEAARSYTASAASQA